MSSRRTGTFRTTRRPPMPATSRSPAECAQERRAGRHKTQAHTEDRHRRGVDSVSSGRKAMTLSQTMGRGEPCFAWEYLDTSPQIRNRPSGKAIIIRQLNGSRVRDPALGAFNPSRSKHPASRGILLRSTEEKPLFINCSFKCVCWLTVSSLGTPYS